MKRGYFYIPYLSPIFRFLRRSALSLVYAGDGVECPVCERSFKSWIRGEDNGICPYCRSVTRQRMLVLYLAGVTRDHDRPMRVLYFAPSWGVERWLRTRSEFDCTTTDLEAPGVDVHADITDLQFADDSYDCVLCSHVLEHVPDDTSAVSEIFRVLRRNGTALILVPYDRFRTQTDEDPSVTDPREREQRFGQWDHVRLYGCDIIDRLRAPGFKVHAEHIMHKLAPEDAKRLGLWDDTIFVCRKT